MRALGTSCAGTSVRAAPQDPSAAPAHTPACLHFKALLMFVLRCHEHWCLVVCVYESCACVCVCVRVFLHVCMCVCVPQDRRATHIAATEGAERAAREAQMARLEAERRRELLKTEREEAKAKTKALSFNQKVSPNSIAVGAVSQSTQGPWDTAAVMHHAQSIRESAGSLHR